MGPRGCRPGGAAGMATLRLVHEVGLGPTVVAALPERPGASARFVLADGVVQKLPSSAGEFAAALLRPRSLGRTILAGLLREVRGVLS